MINKWLEGFFKKPENKIVFKRKGALTDEEIILEIKKISDDKARADKERIRLELKREEDSLCGPRTQDRNHYLNKAEIDDRLVQIFCAFCGPVTVRFYNENKLWEEVLREEGFE